MNILMINKKSFGIFAVVFVFAVSIGCVNLYAQENANVSDLKIKTLEQVKVLLDEGFEYLKSNQFDDAKLKFEDAFKIAPEEMKGEIGDLISQVDNVVGKEGILMTEETIEKSKQKAKNISKLKQQILEFEEVQREKEKRRIIKLHLDKGRFYYDHGKYQDALIEFNRALTIEPENENAVAYIEETNEAIKQLEHKEEQKDVLARNEQLKELWQNAKEYYHDKRYDDAIRELKRILAINPTDKDAVEYMALAEEMKLFGEKIGEAEKLEDMVNKGKEYFRDRDYDKAIDIWKKVLEEKEDYPGIEILVEQAKLAQIKGEKKIVVEGQKTIRENKMLEIDKAYIPIVVEMNEQEDVREKKTEEEEQLLAIKELRKKAKEQKVSLEFTDADLRSVILFLSRRSGINMMFDEAVFEAEGEDGLQAGAGAGRNIARGRPGGAEGAELEVEQVPVKTYNVTASLTDIPLLDALSLILRSRGLDYEIRPNVIWISTRERIENVPLEAMETRIFDLQFGSPFRGQLRPEPLELETTLESVELGSEDD